MHHFSMGADNAGEGYHASERKGNAFNSTGNEMLCDTGRTEFHGSGVHLIADGARSLYLLDLCLTLDGTQVIPVSSPKSI